MSHENASQRPAIEELFQRATEAGKGTKEMADQLFSIYSLSKLAFRALIEDSEVFDLGAQFVARSIKALRDQGFSREESITLFNGFVSKAQHVNTYRRNKS